ncbi:hypothetical protein [Zooshikella harenae]|uniref:Uncharacterized protein n=1 Tax=Zooshikella harenae TaxID=2827238 RepID=A0ABS5ZCG9_9GAMM|nr:hypothetical protein [Zooshikella harenae]MBU2710622.1 hypothetical protein [Zooshikella harenae]
MCINAVGNSGDNVHLLRKQLTITITYHLTPCGALSVTEVTVIKRQCQRHKCYKNTNLAQDFLSFAE